MDNKISRSIGRMLRSKYFYGATGLGLTALTLLDPGGMRPRESVVRTFKGEGLPLNIEFKCSNVEIILGQQKPDIFPEGRGNAEVRVLLGRLPSLKEFTGEATGPRMLSVDLTGCLRPDGDAVSQEGATGLGRRL